MSDSPKLPFVLLCRYEDESGTGAWVMTDVENKEVGDQVARELQAAGTRLEPMRCELVVNTDEGLARWARGSVRRKQAREQLRRRR